MAGWCSARFLLLLLLGSAGAFPVYDVREGSELEVNVDRGTSFTATGRLSDSRALECFADYGNFGAGTCNILDVSGNQLIKRSTFVFNGNETHEITVAPFTSTASVVCYSDKGGTKKLTCKMLELSGNDLSDSEPVIINADAEEVPFLAITRLSDSVGVLCWSYVLYAAQDRAGVCNKLTLSQGELQVGADFFFDMTHSTSDISVQAFSESSAVLCYSAQGTGTCAMLSLSSDGFQEVCIDASNGAKDIEGYSCDYWYAWTEFCGPDYDDSDFTVETMCCACGGGSSVNVPVDFSLGSDQVFHVKASEFFESIVVVSFTSEQGAVCYADGTDENSVACKVLLVDGTSLTVGSEAEVVNEEPTSWVTATAITDAAALVCYATEQGGNVNGEEFRGVGTCNVLGLMDDGLTVGAGPPNEVNSNPTEHMSLASLDEALAVLCYSDFGAGAGHCVALSMATTTTTTTVTTTTTTSSTTTLTTATETSSTTPHTTTETSSSTTPHTTTETFTTTSDTPNREPILDSGSLPAAFLSAGAGFSAVFMATSSLW